MFHTGYSRGIPAVKAAVALKNLGVAGIVIDDQNPLKRKAEVDPGKEVIKSSSMENMIKAIRSATGKDFIIIGRTAIEQQQQALERAEMLKRAGSDLIIVEAFNDSASNLEFLANKKDYKLTTIQLDKGEAKPWTRSNHEQMGIKIVLLANALRKRWEKRGEGMDSYATKLGLNLFGCRVGI